MDMVSFLSHSVFESCLISNYLWVSILCFYYWIKSWPYRTLKAFIALDAVDLVELYVWNFADRLSYLSTFLQLSAQLAGCFTFCAGFGFVIDAWHEEPAASYASCGKISLLRVMCRLVLEKAQFLFSSVSHFTSFYTKHYLTVCTWLFRM